MRTLPAMFTASLVRMCWVAVDVLLATAVMAYAQIEGPKEFKNRTEGIKSVETALASFTPIALTGCSILAFSPAATTINRSCGSWLIAGSTGTSKVMIRR